jgi:hypothetical protein
MTQRDSPERDDKPMLQILLIEMCIKRTATFFSRETKGKLLRTRTQRGKYTSLRHMTKCCLILLRQKSVKCFIYLYFISTIVLTVVSLEHPTAMQGVENRTI